MPLISIVRFFFTIVSLAILGTAGWLLWSWYHGNVYRTVDGSFHVLRQDWRLWLGALFLVWSLLAVPLGSPIVSPGYEGAIATRTDRRSDGRGRRRFVGLC